MSNGTMIQAGFTDYSEAADYESLARGLKAILRRCLPQNDEGEDNPEFDEDFRAEDAIDAIHEIVGDI